MENTSRADKIFMKSSLEGQKQLMKFGESLAIKKQIDDNRIEKDKKISEYIEIINISIPEGLKNQNYQNSIRDFKELNANFSDKYKIGFEMGIANYQKLDQDKINDDILHLFYGYKLKETFRKRLEKELEAEKKSHEVTQKSFNDLAIESNDLEDTIDKLQNYNFYLINGIYILLFLLISSNMILSFYLFFGPERLYNDTLVVIFNMKYLFLLFMSLIVKTIDFILYPFIYGSEHFKALCFTIIGLISIITYKYNMSFLDMIKGVKYFISTKSINFVTMSKDKISVFYSKVKKKFLKGD